MGTTTLTLTADDGTLTGREADGRVDYSFNLASVPTGSSVRFSFQVSNVQTSENVDLQVVIGGVAYKLIDVPDNNGGQFYVVDIPASQLQVGDNTVRLVALASNNGFNVDAVGATFTIPNQAPTAPATNEVTTAEDSASVAVAIGATDADGDALTYSVKDGAGPAHGSVSFANGQFTYTPDADSHGTDSFTLLVSDGKGGTTEQVVSVTVTPVNDAPLAADDTSATAEDLAVTLTAAQLLGNDSDIDSATLTITAVGAAQNGTVVLNADGTVTFTPDADYNGPASFEYTVSDGALTDTGTVNLTISAVNDAPVADASQAVATDEDTAVAVTVTANDVDGDALTFTAGAAARGTVTSNGNGSFTYTPDANYFGSDSFEVTIDDGNGGSTTQVVNITVNPVNDAPEAPATNAVTTDEDTASTAVAIGATDVDSPLSYAVKEGAGPSRGAVSFDATAGTFTYTPSPNENGSDSFTILISDGAVTIEQVVSVTINPVNDAPVASDGSNAGLEDALISGSVPAATDVDSTNLSYALVSGAVDGNGQAVSGLQFNGDGSYSFQGPANFNGRITFAYLASDGELTSNVATITLDVASVNDAPSGADKTVTTAEDTPYVFTAADFGFTDSDGNSLAAVKITSAPLADTLLLDGAAVAAGALVSRADIDAGKLSFAPAPNANNGSNSAYASFAFQVQDDGGTANGGIDLDGSPNSLTISVTPVNDDPVAANDSFGTGVAKVYEGSEFIIDIADLLANDSDVDGDLVQFLEHFQPSQHGTVTKVTDLNGTSYLAFSYTGPALAEGATQAVSFEYQVSDGQGGTGTGTVSLLVTGLANRMTYGTNGIDTLNGSNSARDTIDGLNGDDVIYGHGGDDKLFGQNGVDRLYGGDGADTLDGGRGDDWLEGGRGNDIMTGGLGADMFAIGQNANGVVVNTGTDKITDFKVGTDHIRLQTGVALANSGGISYSDVDADNVVDTVLKLNNGGTVQLLGVGELPSAEVLFG